MYEGVFQVKEQTIEMAERLVDSGWLPLEAIMEALGHESERKGNSDAGIEQEG